MQVLWNCDHGNKEILSGSKIVDISDSIWKKAENSQLGVKNRYSSWNVFVQVRLHLTLTSHRYIRMHFYRFANRVDLDQVDPVGFSYLVLWSGSTLIAYKIS